MMTRIIYSIGWRLLIVLLTAYIAYVSVERYLAGGEPGPSGILANGFANPFLVLHVAGGVSALVLMPLQFVGPIRRAAPWFHRFIGRLSVLACVIGAPAGFMLALGTTAGPVAGAGFASLACLWALFIWLGWRAAIARRFDAHRAWMLRAYAMVAAAITLRLMLPASAMLGFDFVASYRAIAWLAWITNLALVELYIRRKRASIGTETALAAG
jgi:hypothetical protein